MLISFKPTNLTIAIVLTFTLILVFLWQLHASDSKKRLHVAKQVEWLQPPSLSTHFPQPISAQTWTFDFEATESVLLAILQTENSALRLNANIAQLLEKAVSSLPSGLDDSSLHRVALLTSKSLSGKAGSELAKILTDFYRFKRAWNIVKVNPTSTLNKESLFQEMVLLQNKYLGKKVAKQLFGQQNAVTRYLYARKHINEDTHLNPSQKHDELDQLNIRFKANDL